MKKITVSARDLFKGEKGGGLTYEQWAVADDLGKLESRLAFIADRAQALSEVPYTPDSDFPANILRDAMILAQTARSGLLAVHNRDIMSAAWYSLDAGKQMGQLNTLLNAWERLQVTLIQRSGNSKGGKVPKRKEWADRLAGYLAAPGVSFPKAWAQITEDENAPLEIDEDTAFFLSNNRETLIAVDSVTGNEIGEMSQSNFKKRYFSPAKKNRDTN